MKRTTILLGAGIMLLCSMVFALVPSEAEGAVPQLINFQGILRDGSGNPVANGSYSVTFTIYDLPGSGATTLWSETQSVSTVNGLFTVLLGSGPIPLADTLFNDSTRWLGIQVAGDPEMTPRQRLSSVGYSYMSSPWNQRDSIVYRYGKVSLGDYVDANSRLYVRESASQPFTKLALQAIASNGSSGDAIGGEFTAGNAGTGTHYGVYGQAYGSANTYGVYSIGSTFGSGVGYGGYFEGYSSGNVAYGVYSRCTGGNSVAVYADGAYNGIVSYGNTGTGVYGYGGGYAGVEADGGTYGVDASGTSYGVYAFSSGGDGVYATGPGNGVTASGTVRGVYATGGSWGVVGAASANGGAGVYGSNGGNSLTWGGYFVGDTYVTGNFTAAGFKSATVKVDNGEYRLLYAQESPENWFEDFGTAQLVNGKAIVNIEPTFAQTVNTAVAYHVFLTPKGDCRGLFVSNETPSSFEIRELQNGKSDIAVSYRIVAKRKGYENVRLAKLARPTPEEAQAKDAELRAEMAKEAAKRQEERAKMEAERKKMEEQRAKMEQERVIQEQKIKENK